MPTGYTAIIEDKPDVTFREFILRCARGMGACVMQRDDSLNEPPQMDEPSNYHSEALERSRKELDRLEGMSPGQIQLAHKARREKCADELSKTAKSVDAKKAAYARMLAEVEAWEPPTPEHVGLKDFMRQQISISKPYESDGQYWRDLLTKIESEQPAEWHAGEIAQAKRNIEYHEQHLREERERCEERNQWKRQLFESLEVGATP